MCPPGFTSSLVTSPMIFMKCSSDLGQSWLQAGPFPAPVGPMNFGSIGKLKKILPIVNLLSLRGSSGIPCAPNVKIPIVRIAIHTNDILRLWNRPVNLLFQSFIVHGKPSFFISLLRSISAAIPAPRDKREQFQGNE